MLSAQKMIEFPASWYPICLTGEILKGELRPITLFHRSWVLFRGHDGVAGIIDRHCLHMGTDLANGVVIENSVRCPFHLWTYQSSGACTRKGAGSHCRTPVALELLSLHCLETNGIVYCFFGDQAAFECPGQLGETGNPKQIHGSIVSKTLETPYQALIFNGFDSHHLECIHHRKITETPLLTQLSAHHFRGIFSMQVICSTFYDALVYRLGSRVQRFQLDCFGGNNLTITNERTRDQIIITSVPLEMNKSRIFIVAVTEGHGGFLRKNIDLLRLSITSWLAMLFLRPDIRIVTNMRPEHRNLISEHDWPIKKFWDYWNGIPKFSVKPNL